MTFARRLILTISAGLFGIAGLSIASLVAAGLVATVALSGTPAVAADKFQEGELTEANYAKWRDHVLPRNWELAYRRLPWRTSFWEAVVEAQEKDKPILLWAMNGHPLCNT